MYLSLLSRFILLEVISESDDMPSIDVEDLDVLKYFNSILIGAMTKQHASDSDIIGASTFLFQSERHQATLDKLHVLMQKFSRVITDMNVLESELLEYQATPDEAHIQ